jgi:hypothetical protein
MNMEIGNDTGTIKEANISRGEGQYSQGRKNIQYIW